MSQTSECLKLVTAEPLNDSQTDAESLADQKRIIIEQNERSINQVLDYIRTHDCHSC